MYYINTSVHTCSFFTKSIAYGCFRYCTDTHRLWAIAQSEFQCFQEVPVYHKVNMCKCCMLHTFIYFMLFLLLLRCTFLEYPGKKLKNVLFRLLLYAHLQQIYVYMSLQKMWIFFNLNCCKFTAYNTTNSWMQ